MLLAEQNFDVATNLANQVRMRQTRYCGLGH